ncbi:hypothetical protein PAPYR_11266 [Paratrimastix pyriformis]|uniref:Uncharacterized protein n=1 Tax=Paratrimastix pyriformis TaxID=342808 RepID=A0ABQ8U490_9EUKA|nr:hypothetical protein PAPYR_11266 [Paratrimastix pyriformis]
MSILLIKFLDVSAVLRACCASVHSFLVWVCLGLSHEGCPSFSELVKEKDSGGCDGTVISPVDRTVGEGGNGRVGADMELVVGDGDSGM